MVLSFDGLRMIQRARLTGQVRSVLDCFFERLEGNIISDAKHGSVAGQLNISPSCVSRAISELEHFDIVQRTKARGVMLLNPHVGFKGSTVAQRAAVRQWDAAHRPIAVPDSVAS